MMKDVLRPLKLPRSKTACFRKGRMIRSECGPKVAFRLDVCLNRSNPSIVTICEQNAKGEPTVLIVA